MIKNLLFVIAVIALSIGTYAYAHEPSKHGSGNAATVQGEVLDSACYFTHEAKGKGHADCAAKCIQKGIPMALLDSKGEIYLLNENHDKPQPYADLKNKAAETVTVSGNLVEKKGWKVLFVESVK